MGYGSIFSSFRIFMFSRLSVPGYFLFMYATESLVVILYLVEIEMEGCSFRKVVLLYMTTTC